MNTNAWKSFLTLFQDKQIKKNWMSFNQAGLFTNILITKRILINKRPLFGLEKKKYKPWHINSCSFFDWIETKSNDQEEFSLTVE